MNKEEWDKAEERADREEREGKFKEFDNVQDLIADLKRPVTRLCNFPGCNTCLCPCIWKARA